MPKYLFRYVGDGVKGLLKDGGSKRRTVTEKLFKSLGGSLDAIDAVEFVALLNSQGGLRRAESWIS